MAIVSIISFSMGERSFRFVKGPVFASITLANEINHIPPKTRLALLQAMEEYKVTVAEQTYHVPKRNYKNGKR